MPAGAKVVSTGEDSNHYELTYRVEATGDEYKVVLHKNPLSVKKVDIDYKDKKGSKTVVLTEAQVAAQVLGAYPGAAINGIFVEKDSGLFEYVAIFERDGYLYQMLQRQGWREHRRQDQGVRPCSSPAGEQFILMIRPRPARWSK